MSNVLPPVIRVFISSTFADIARERQYFNTVIAPQLTRLCAERGVSFFSVDLRWGITQEDQLSGNVIPICLREIDNCRPFFIGILGNRYGSIPESVASAAGDAFPWLGDQTGKSVTELEMYYGVLRRESGREAPSCAFFFRADALSREFYPETESEDKQEKLARLKREIRQDDSIPAFDYRSLEEFGQEVIDVVTRWLYRAFPNAKSVRQARKNWYNSELLRDYVNLKDVQDFLDSYCGGDARSLILSGAGLRGKTTALTAWEPKDGTKLLINCGADAEYQYWPSVAHEIINRLREIDEDVGFPEFEAKASLYFWLMDGLNDREDPDGSIRYYVTDSERESFRRGFVSWLRTIRPKTPVYIVVNDLNLLGDPSAAYLTWLPEETGENVRLICSANGETIPENARALGWNVKELPLFSPENASAFLDRYMSIFGKSMSAAQKENLLASPLLRYPGYLKFIIRYLNNYGSFETLDRLTGAIGGMTAEEELYRFILDSIAASMTGSEKRAAETALYTLAVTSLGLREEELFALVQKLSPVDAIGWSRVREILEQFQLITADLWQIRDSCLAGIAGQFSVDRKAIHLALAELFLAQIQGDIARTPDSIKRCTECAKAGLMHLAEAEDWDGLAAQLQSWTVLYYLSKLEWNTVRSMWMQLLIRSELDVSGLLTACFDQRETRFGGIEGIDQRLLSLMVDLELHSAAQEVSSRSGLPIVSGLNSIDASVFSEDNRMVYERFNRLKDRRRFLTLAEESESYLANNGDTMDPMEKTAFLLLKLDSETQIGDLQKALATAYDYYTSAILAMCDYDILRAVLSRGQLLYRAGRYGEAKKALDYCRELALDLGDLREYLSVLNSTGMYDYRVERYDESLAAFDTCIRTWKRLGNDRETINCTMNKCNALYLSGNFGGAAEEAEALLRMIRSLDGEGYAGLTAKVLGNLGRYYAELGRPEDSERAYLESLEEAKKSSEEASNSYEGLISHYRDRRQFARAMGVYGDYADYLYERKLYPQLARAVKDCLVLMQIGGYSHEAKAFREKWEAVFDGLPGGRELLDGAEGDAGDPYLESSLREELAVARGEGDGEKSGEILWKLAEAAAARNDESAGGLLQQAMEAFSQAGNRQRAEECACGIVSLLIDSGREDPRFSRALAALSPGDRETAELWLRLRNADDGDLAAEANRLLDRYSPGNGLAVRCLIHEAERLVEKLPEETLLRAAALTKDDPGYPELRAALSRAASADFNDDLDYLRRNYMDSRAERLLAAYEKRISLLDALELSDAGAIAGNLALIYRRRRDREETIRHHETAARIYGAHAQTRDMFIEQLNLSTAYREFGEPERAVELLRSVLRDPRLASCGDIQAAVAGNLAAFLSQKADPAVQEEVISCFALEEAYFERTGEARELAISLLNQLRYHLLCGTGSPELLREKYRKAEQLAAAHNLNEFTQALRVLKAQLDPEPEPEAKPAPKAEKKVSGLRRLFGRKNSAVGQTSPDQLLDRLTGRDGDFAVGETDERTETSLHALLFPKKEVRMVKVNVHLWIDCAEGCRMKYLFVMQPSDPSGKARPYLRQYTDWWNEQGDYPLHLDENEEGVLLLTNGETAGDPERIAAAFDRVRRLWEADVLCASLCVLGFADLHELQELKGKALRQ